MPRKQITPVSSPQKERYGDRFIPSRAGNNWQVNFNMIQVSLSVFVCIFIILIGPFIIIFNIVSDIRGWDKTFPALADADIKQMTKCRGIPDLFLYLESVIHFAHQFYV